MKTTAFTAVMIFSVAGFSALSHAAPVDILNPSLQISASLQPAAPRGEPEPSHAPLSLLEPRVVCDATESAKVCAVRQAAVQRAGEVVAAEAATLRDKPLGLLIPVGLTPVRQVAAVICAPGTTAQECDQLNRRPSSAQPRLFSPSAPTPPTVPVPAPIPPSVAVPQAAPPPIVADPQSIVRPPPTGDGDLVKRPPPTDPEMPVIKPKPNPPVTQ
jgi:hypothetical protein